MGSGQESIEGGKNPGHKCQQGALILVCLSVTDFRGTILIYRIILIYRNYSDLQELF